MSVTEKDSTIKGGEVESDNHPTTAVKRNLFPDGFTYCSVTSDEAGTAKTDEFITNRILLCHIMSIHSEKNHSIMLINQWCTFQCGFNRLLQMTGLLKEMG